MSVLELRHVAKHFGAIEAVKDVMRAEPGVFRGAHRDNVFHRAKRFDVIDDGRLAE